MSTTVRAAPSSSVVPSPQASDEVTSKKIFGWSLEVEPSSSSEGFRASFMGGRSTPERARRGAPRRARWFSPRESSRMMRGTPTRWLSSSDRCVQPPRTLPDPERRAFSTRGFPFRPSPTRARPFPTHLWTCLDSQPSRPRHRIATPETGVRRHPPRPVERGGAVQQLRGDDVQVEGAHVGGFRVCRRRAV